MKLHLVVAALGTLLLGVGQALAATIGEDAMHCQNGKGPAIQVNVQGLKDRTGELWLELYPETPDDYLRPDMELVAEGKIFRRARGPLPASGEVAICVRVPRPGRYALMLRHNRVGRDKFSIWQDGVGLPANRALVRSRPSFDQAKIDAAQGVTRVSIKLQYLRGFGFYPND